MWEVPTGHQRDGTRTRSRGVTARCAEPLTPPPTCCVHRDPPMARRDRGCVPSGGSRVPSTRASCHAGQRRFTTFAAWYCLSPEHRLSISVRRSRRLGKAMIIKRKRPTWHTAQVGRLSLPDREGDRMLEPASSPHDTCVCSFAYLVSLRIHATTPEKPAGLDDLPIRANAFERAHTSPDTTQLRGHACARLERSRSHAVE
jgi:hypothetical protein